MRNNVIDLGEHEQLRHLSELIFKKIPVENRPTVGELMDTISDELHRIMSRR